MITVAEADRLLRQHRFAPRAETVALREAHGRVLLEDVVSDRDYPPFDRVAMDGVALAYAPQGPGRWRVQATQQAGQPPFRLERAGDCIEIMTGAALSEGCDTVVRYEDLAIADGFASLADGVDVAPGQNVHRRGSDCRAGETVLRTGLLLTPPRIAVLASLGKTHVRVAASPRIEIVTTGDELVEVGAPILPHQIRQSNGHAIQAALASHGLGAATLWHVPDDKALLRDGLAAALETADVLLVTGGVSAGRFDFVPGLLKSLDVTERFHKIRQRPGKPLWFGTAADGRPVFGLPGNPNSSLVCLYRYVLPLLGVAPPPVHLTLARQPRRTGDLTYFVGVRLEAGTAHPVRAGGSGDFLALAPSDGFVEVDPGPGPVAFYPW
jgi:molybdopterin molybdotransferase